MLIGIVFSAFCIITNSIRIISAFTKYGMDFVNCDKFCQWTQHQIRNKTHFFTVLFTVETLTNYINLTCICGKWKILIGYVEHKKQWSWNVWCDITDKLRVDMERRAVRLLDLILDFFSGGETLKIHMVYKEKPTILRYVTTDYCSLYVNNPILLEEQ